MDELEIAEKCPVCNTYYGWDNESETYQGTTVTTCQLGGKHVTLCSCPVDGAVVSVLVTDRHGSRVYTPAPHTIMDW